MQYGNTVKFEGQRLFSGAIDLDWIYSDFEKAKRVAGAYVFHGKNYHAANTQDNSVVSGHKLTDSVSMVEEVIASLSGDNNNMLLAIAGYGAGKSHFALSLATLLSVQDPIIRDEVISRINSIEPEAARRIRSFVEDDKRPFLVIPINGMRNANLKDLFFLTVNRVLDRYNVSKSCLNDFDPRFEFLKELVSNHRDTNIIERVLNDSAINSIDEFKKRMDNFDEVVYNKVVNNLDRYKIRVFKPAATGELKDIIVSVANTLCGDDKLFRGMLIIFDEFGKYMSFAAGNEAIAGSGIMQQLFEGIQSAEETSHVVLLGMSQLDLIEYQRGVGNLAFSNNMNRYVTRFDAAKRCYLSVCFESLVANLIVKEPVKLIKPILHRVGDKR